MITEEIRDYYNQIAPQREFWQKKNSYYHEDVQSFMRYHIPEGSKVLDIGCGQGDLLASLKPSDGLGIDISEGMIKLAKSKFPGLRFLVANAEELPIEEKFDFVILSDTIGLFPDVQKVFNQLGKVTHDETRIIITYYNYLWEPILSLWQAIGLKMPTPVQNWLPLQQTRNLLYLADYEVVKKGYRFLFPWKIQYLSTFINRFIAKLPLIQQLCHSEWLIAKPITRPKLSDELSCSVIIPCRNERDNIENAISRTPLMGKFTEFIFVDGRSSDGTVEMIQEVQKKYKEHDIKLLHQTEAKGKYDAVKIGFAAAKGDVLMILDADLTVPPEDLPKFFNALSEGKGEFINGTRLVYPMEKEAMRVLNIFGNKFFGLAFSYLLEQKFSDTLCGTKVMTKKNYERLAKNRAYFGDFDPFGDFDLIFGASKLNLKIIELPIRYKERVYGTTKIRRFYHGMILLKMCLVAMRKLKFV